MTKPCLLLAVCSLLLSSLLVACVSSDDAWGRICSTGVLRVGMDASFPPFEYVTSDGALVGFDVDLARELGRRLGLALNVDSRCVAEGVEVQFVANLPYDGLYDALKVGRVDVVISALVVNPAQMADFAYSATYFDAGQVLVVRRGQVGIEGMGDLRGRSLAVELGTQGDLEGRKWARRLPDLVVVSYQTAAEALAAVVEDQAEAALVDRVSALAEDRETLVIVGDPVAEEPYAVAVYRDNRYLLKAIDEALAEMEADGTTAGLVAQWLEGAP